MRGPRQLVVEPWVWWQRSNPIFERCALCGVVYVDVLEDGCPDCHGSKNPRRSLA